MPDPHDRQIFVADGLTHITLTTQGDTVYYLIEEPGQKPVKFSLSQSVFKQLRFAEEKLARQNESPGPEPLLKVI